MGRTFGPFTDVSTARVDGAYEIYQGQDEEQREVEILTLGVTSSKDPSRRALLSDTVAWAHATRGPADAPILSADLNSEQPYVVTLRKVGFRGVERMMERMLAMGPPTGPLSAPTGQHTGQIPVVGYHTNPQGIPRVMSAPPASGSPMTPYVVKSKGNRPPWLVPIIVVLSLLILSTGGFLVVEGMSGDDGVTAADENGATGTEPDDAQPPAEPEPEPDDPLPTWRKNVDAEVVGPGNFTAEQGDVVAQAGWPFAFKVGDGIACHPDGDLGTTCRSTDAGDRDAITVELRIQECTDPCGTSEREFVLQRWWDAQGMQYQDYDARTSTAVFGADGTTTVAMNHFFLPPHNSGAFDTKYLQVGVVVVGPDDQAETLQAIVNDIYAQSHVRG